jgi:hypothetical protein
MLPVLAKYTFRPRTFLLAGFGGLYFTIPLKPMIYEGEKDKNGDRMQFEYDFNGPVGFIVGGNAGIKLGPGTLFLDIRYAGDITDFEVKGDWGSRAIYKRSLVVFSMGYEFGFGSVKGK